MNKKIITLVMAFLFTSTAFASPDWSYDPKVDAILNTSADEVEDGDIIWDLLSKLNILDTKAKDFKADSNYTREAFLNSVCFAFGRDADDYTKSLEQRGILSKDFGGKYISFYDAVAICTDLSGYGIYCDKGDYTSIAKTNGLLKNLNYISGNKITYREGIQLVYNLISIPLCKIEFSSKKVSVSSENKSLLEQKYNLRLLKGTITRINASGIYKSVENENDVIEIDRYLYRTENPLDLELLGKNAVAFYDTENEKIVLVRENKNNIVNIKDVEFIDSSVMEDSDTKIKMSNTANIVLNGSYLGKYSLKYNDLEKADEITAIDNDKDGRFDVVIAWKYFHTVADMDIGLETNSIVFSYNEMYQGKNTIELDADANDKNIIIEKDGKTAAPEEIKKGVALSISQSENDVGCKTVRVIISDKKISGKIKDIREKDEKCYITVGNTEYRLSDAYLEYCGWPLGNDYGEVVYPKVGSTYTFILTANDTIAGIDKSDDNLLWGYLTKVWIDDEADEPVTYFKVFTAEGEFKKFQSAKKLSYYDQNHLTGIKLKSEEADAMIKGLPQEKDNRKIIAYSLNVNGEITKLFMPVSTQDTEYPNNIAASVTSSYWYYGSKFWAAGNWHIGPYGVLVFQVPDVDNADLESAYRVLDSLAGNEKYDITLFGSDEYHACHCGLIVDTSEASMEGQNTGLLIVESQVLETNSNDDVVYKCYAWDEYGKRVALSVPENDDMVSYGSSQSENDMNWIKNVKFSELKFGDAIQVSKNASTGYVTQFKLLFRIDDWKNQTLRYQNYYGKLTDTDGEELEKARNYFGFLQYVSMKQYPSTGMRMSKFKTDNNVDIIIQENTSHGYAVRYLINTTKKTVTPISQADVVSGDRCLINRGYGGIRLMAIIR